MIDAIARYGDRSHVRHCGHSRTRAGRRPRWSRRSSGWSTGVMIPRRGRRWRAGRARPPRAEGGCATSKPGSSASRSPAPSASAIPVAATHGKPSETTPSPRHRLARSRANGIIENFPRAAHGAGTEGAKFGSETDTEVVAHLVTQEIDGLAPRSRRWRRRCRACAAPRPRLFAGGENDLMIGARKARRSQSVTATAEMYSAPTRLRWLPSPT